MSDELSWKDVERIISDLKNDGYEPTNLDTSNSYAATTKTVFLDLRRNIDTEE